MKKKYLLIIIITFFCFMPFINVQADTTDGWVKENGDNEIGHLMRDFLSEVKGYCLIHNPTGCGGYIVTNMKSLTKRQKEFLYGYFMDMGDRFKAEQFIKE